MTDLRLRILGGAGGTDLEVAAGDFALDQGLDTAVLVSLFTDARAPADADLPGEADDRRGWWGQDNADPFGSLLWLVLERGVRTAEAATLAAGYAREALQWMIREEIAASVDVASTFEADGLLYLRVDITRGPSRRWAHLWTGQREKILEAGDTRVKLILR